MAASSLCRWVGVILLAAPALVLITGCGGGPRRVPVSGQVTLDGAPLNQGVIHFYPDSTKGNEHRIACLSPVRSGKYNLITTAVKDAHTGEGVPLGWYKVYLDTTMPGVDVKIHERFTDANKTPIFIEVVDDPAADAYHIKFTSK